MQAVFGQPHEVQTMTAADTPSRETLTIREELALIICPAKGADYSDDPKLTAIIEESYQDALLTADKILLRLAAKPADEGVREATIEECAQAGITPLTDAQKENVEHGFGALLRFEAIWNLAQKTSVAAIRALSTTREQKPTRQGVCSTCDGHGVVRVPLAGGPYMSIAERESHDSEGQE
jgi:hypothetical protein